MSNGRKRILIVDSDDRVLIALERLMEDEGLQTATTWSAQEALQLVRSGEFDLLLMGDHLPDLSCEQFLREVQNAGSLADVLVMDSSVSRAPSIASYFLSLGATATVRKWNYGEVVQRAKALVSVSGRSSAKAA